MKFPIVTPSYNQGAFIERTIQSVQAQAGDFEVEHIVMDGGSTDDTLAVLRRYTDRLQWTSQPDDGQSDAINQGFRRATGDILAWLNSDDTYQPGALQAVAESYAREPFDWCFGNCHIVDEHDRPIRTAITAYKVAQSRRYNYRRLLRRDFIPQPAAFFSCAACERTGDIARDLVYSMDYDYWLRLGQAAAPRYIDRFLANFRWHTASKNGALYRRAAWETYQTARRHARPGNRLDLACHFLHVLTLSVLYRFL